MLASASLDRTVRLWDIATGRSVRTLRGHAGSVLAVSFSPGGRTLASASDDRTVRIWDVATGQVVLTLRGHASAVMTVAFSPDGRTLASAGADRTIKLWDASEVTPERRIVREALSVVEFHFAKSPPTEEVLTRINVDSTISEPVRQLAITLGEQHGHSLLVHEAVRVVNALFAKPMFRPEVLENLRADPALSEPVRREALILAKTTKEDPSQMNLASWSVVRSQGAEPAAYIRALRQAEAACTLCPRNGAYLSTRGVALYRVGRYHEALETLTQSVSLPVSHGDGSTPRDLAFLALSYARLGQTVRARATLSHLREMMKNPAWAENEESQELLPEAETIELDLVFPADPFAH